MPESSYSRFIELRLESPSRGLATARQAESLVEKVSENLPYGILCVPYECTESLNFIAEKIEGEFNGLVSRDGLVEITTSADLPNSILNMAFVDVSGVARKVVSCGDDKLYYLSSAATPVWTEIGEANATASFVPMGYLYGDTYGEQVLVVADGRRPHMYRPNCSDSQKYQICYDSNGYMIDYITGYSETSIQLRTGSIIRAGIQQTLSAWCNHADPTIDSIPLIAVSCRLKITGAPTGTIAATMRDTATRTLLATSSSLSVALIGSNWSTYTFTFDGSVGMLPSDAMTWSLEFTSTSSDVSNYVEIADAAITNGGEVTYTGAGGYSTTNAATRGVLLRISPGLAPTIENCFSYGGRVWGTKPDGNLGYLAYSDALNPNKWTGDVQPGNLLPDAGVLAIGSAGGEITSVIPMEDQTYIIKGGAVAEIYKLTGTGPSDFDLNKAMDGVRGTNFFAAVNAGNDGFIFDPKGLVQLSIALDTQKTTEAVQSRDRIDNGFSLLTAPRLANISRYGHVWLYDTTMSNILIYDTEIDFWSSIQFKNITHTFICDGPDYIYVGGSNGKLYRVSPGTSTDDGTQFDLYYKTSFTNCGTAAEKKIFRRLDLEVSVTILANGYLYLYRDGNHVSDFNRYFDVPMYSGTLVGDLAPFTVGDLDFPLSGSLGDSTFIYDSNLAASSFAGFDLTQFGFGANGPALIGTDYVFVYDCRRIMAKLDFSTFIGKVRLRKLTLRGDLIGRRID